ncbi:28S ribosomal protein S17, mitochondrial [Condylostylus longicornis]|uniref:28S ribosomal protein S17, mitochondrial n=1 Tax=Condylostylus longicornis TaxID=2530218 RepID=UPI00244E1682|nr:28S ribosomal protein S17, mitochondrial [Condylostylus longicornis]
MDFDKNLNMYFHKDEFIFAHDPEKKCKSGDIVLVKELPERLTRLITHSIQEIIYPLGDITDPITGKKVVVGKYRDEIEHTNKLYGKSDKSFSYEKAPPRGRLEGTRDFTHGETYIKYHEDGKDQPFAV